MIEDEILNILPISKIDLKAQKFFKDDESKIHFEDSASSNYLWKVMDTKFGQIDSKAILKSGSKPGLIEVIATDKLFDTNKAQLLVNVVEPARIDLNIADITDKLSRSFDPKGFGKNSYQRQLGVEQWDNQWVLVEKRKYLVKAALYDEHNNKIHLSDNLNFGNFIDTTHLKTIHINKISSEILFEVLPLND